MKTGWYFDSEIDPQSGGNKIPKEAQTNVENLVAAFEKTRPWFPRIRLQTRFKNQFCYLEALEKGETSPLCRLRFFNEKEWSLGFYAYSSERYQPCIFSSGKWLGSVEEAIKICEECYLH